MLRFALASLLLAVSPAYATLITNHVSSIDGATVVFDPVNQLEILPFPATSGYSVSEIVGGAGGFAAAGWRHATTAQVCAFSTTNAPTLVTSCPPRGDYYHNIYQMDPSEVPEYDAIRNEVHTIIQALGATHYGYFYPSESTITQGFFDGGRIFIETQRFDTGTVRLRLTTDYYNQGQEEPTHFLVRSSVPEPTTALLLIVGVQILAAARRPKQT